MPATLPVQSYWERLPAESAGMGVRVSSPAEPGVYPGLVCFHAIPGVNAQLQKMAEQIAAHGYVVATPHYYHRVTPQTEFRIPDEREAALNAWSSVDYYGLAADGRLTLNFLRDLPSVNASCLGVIGYCTGGMVSFFTTCVQSDVSAAAVLYGTDIASCTPTPGRPIAPLALAERIQAPMLWLSGGADEVVPPRDVEAIAARMRELDKTFEWHIYDGAPPAGHAFFSADQPRFYNEGAADWGWELKLAFLEKHLRLA